MAALTSDLAFPIWSEGHATKIVVYAIRKVTTNDTLNVSGTLSTVFYARFFILNRSAESAPAISAVTTLTFDAASIAADAGYLVVIGGGASPQ